MTSDNDRADYFLLVHILSEVIKGLPRMPRQLSLHHLLTHDSGLVTSDWTLLHFAFQLVLWGSSSRVIYLPRHLPRWGSRGGERYWPGLFLGAAAAGQLPSLPLFPSFPAGVPALRFTFLHCVVILATLISVLHFGFNIQRELHSLSFPDHPVGLRSMCSTPSPLLAPAAFQVNASQIFAATLFCNWWKNCNHYVDDT